MTVLDIAGARATRSIDTFPVGADPALSALVCDVDPWDIELDDLECSNHASLAGPPPVAEVEEQIELLATEAAGILHMLASHSATAATLVLEVVRDVLQGHVHDGAADSQAACIDQISVLETVKCASAAAQAVKTEKFRMLRNEREQDAGVPSDKRLRGIGSEIGLARRESPQAGSSAIRVAHTLCAEMPEALAALSEGRLCEFTAGLVTKEVQHLDPAARSAIDEAMADRYGKAGSRRLAGEVRALAQQADPVAYIKAHEIAKSARSVTVRPAPSGMSYLTALLPLGQAFACKKALRDAAAVTATSNETVARSGAQMEADLLVERLTGQPAADAVRIEVQLVMNDESLLGVTTNMPKRSAGTFDRSTGATVDATGRLAEGAFSPAWMPGFGPIPAALAREMLDAVHDHGDPARVYLRRILTDPVTGEVTKIDSLKRLFDGALRRALVLRDEQCRTPWCNAPIAHLDHAHPFALGGRTSMANGTGLCARCNYVKENPGWRHSPSSDSSGAGGRIVRTPTGHSYRSDPPPLLPSLTRRL